MLFEGVLGYPHLIPVTGMSTDQALAFILRQFDDRAQLATQIAAGNARVADQLKIYTDELEALFASTMQPSAT